MKTWQKRLAGLLVLAALVAGVYGFTVKTEAANIIPERGHVIVDLDDFVLQEATDDDCGLEKSGTGYMLHYENGFTDRNNTGVTYRSKNMFDMTDVTSIEHFMYNQQGKADKFFIYVDNVKNHNYHRLDNDDITYATFGGNGQVWSFSQFAYKIYDFYYSDTYLKYTTSLVPSAIDKYVFIGIAHEWRWHDAKVYLDNETRNGDNHGGITLLLKKHNITMLQPDYPQRLKEDGSREDYIAFTNLSMSLDDGKTYAPGSTGSIYRDERMVFKYTLTDPGNCWLTGFNFYSDKGKTNLLYTYDVTGKENQTTVTFDSSLIEKLETDKNGKHNVGSLKDIYVEPVFERRAVDVIWSSNVAETNGKVTIEKAENNIYQLKDYTKEAAGELIGQFKMNAPEDKYAIGDAITIKYTPNAGYAGDYQFQYYEIRECENANQVGGTYADVIGISEQGTYDVDLELKDTCFWIQPHLRIKAELKLSDKKSSFTNHEQTIGEAEIIWPENERKPSGAIAYHYYEDEDLTKELSSLPVNAGTYYVKAVMAKDTYYTETESNVAKFVIEKAEPSFRSVKGTDITYGQTLDESEISGTAVGVTGTTITGTFAWKDGSIAPRAGRDRQYCIFTPSAQFQNNYKETEYYAFVTVNKAMPKIILADTMATYDGAGKEATGAKTSGVYGEETGQVIKFEYYADAECKKELDDVPINAGTYYVLGKVYEQGNYKYAKTSVEEKATLTIKKREANLVQVPVSAFKKAEGGEYRVYVTNVVNEDVVGKISLSINGTSVGSAQTIQKAGGKSYATFTYGDLPEIAGNTAEYEVTASYTAGNPDNYEIKNNTICWKKGDLVVQKEIELVYSGNAVKQNVLKDFFPEATIERANVTWNFPENDVASFSYHEDTNTLTITPVNAGSIVVSGYMNVGDESAYISYICNVEQSEQVLELNFPESLVYNGLPKEVTVQRTSPDVDKEDVTKAAQITVVPEKVTEPVDPEKAVEAIDVGNYTITASVAESRNLKAATVSKKMTITPAKPKVTLSSKIVIYNGEEQEMDGAVCEGILPYGTEVTGEITYLYGIKQENVVGPDITPLYPIDEIDVIEAGTYRVVARLAADGNYSSADSNIAELIIKPAPCTVTLESKEVTYDGKPHSLDGGVKIFDKDGREISKENFEKSEYTIHYKNSVTGETVDVPIEGGLYYAYVEKTDKGNYDEAVSEQATLLITPVDVEVSLQDVEKVYDGKNADAAVAEKAKVTFGETDVTEGSTFTCEYYRDSEGTEMIPAPTDAGTYYVRVTMNPRSSFNSATSNLAKLVIQKAVPEISATTTSIYYGQIGADSVINGIATGVNGEQTEGTFKMDSSQEVYYNPMPVGTYTVTVHFTPGEGYAQNYAETSCKTTLTIKPAIPTIVGENKTLTYNGKSVELNEVGVNGANGMEAVSAKPEYRYYSDKDCKNEVAKEEVKDAGTYYCKVTVPAEGNYAATSEVYTVTIEKAPAQLILKPIKNIGTNKVILEGQIVGAVDNPTGSVKIERDFKVIEHSYPIEEIRPGVWGFETEQIAGGQNGTTLFVGIYEKGEKDNYDIQAEILSVMTERLPQYISFEKNVVHVNYHLTRTFYLSLEDKGSSTGAVRYYVIDKIGTPNVVEVDDNGRVNVIGAGIAFVAAVKEGDDFYLPAKAVCMIVVEKLPVAISTERIRLPYGSDGITAENLGFMSGNEKITEKLSFTCTYTKDGKVFYEMPEVPGVYQVTIRIPESEKYQAATLQCEMELFDPHLDLDDEEKGPDVNDGGVSDNGAINTGDGAKLSLWSALFLGAGVVIGITYKRKRRSGKC